MNLHEAVALLELNALYVVAGVGVVWLAAAPTRLLAASHLLGFAAVSAISLVLLTAAGVVPRPATIVAIAAGLAAAGALRARPWTRRIRLRRPRGASPLGVCAGALVVFELAQIFRLAYTQGLVAWDAWSFWTPKAIVITHEGLDPTAFQAVAARTYPLLVPVTDVSVFRFTGSTDVVPLSVQFFVLLAGFVAAAWAVSTLLGARPWTVWPLLALLLALPAGVGRFLAPQGDFLLDYLFAIGLGLALLWARGGGRPLLLLAGVSWAAAASAKREGIAFVAVGAIVVVLAGRPSLRRAAGGALLVLLPVLVLVPWWVWLRRHGVVAETPAPLTEGGGTPTAIVGKAHLIGPALGAVVRATFSTAWWGGAGIVGAAAVAVGLARREPRRAALVVAAVSVLLVAIMVWRLLWGGEGSGTAFESPAFPTRRLTGALVLTWLVVGPALLAAACAPVADRLGRLWVSRLRVPAAVALVPALVLVGVAWSRGDFETVAQRCHLSNVRGNFGVALGPLGSLDETLALQRHVEALGFQHTEIAADTCSGTTIVTPELPSADVARSVLQEARSAHLDASIVPGTG